MAVLLGPDDRSTADSRLGRDLSTSESGGGIEREPIARSQPTEQRRLLALPKEISGPLLRSTDMSAIAFTVQDEGATQGVIPKYDSLTGSS